jgi:hypothetical protein
MLNTPAPFPQVGSYALVVHEGKTRLARIIQRDPGGDRIGISLPQRYGAAGVLTVAFEELIDGTPLSDAERAELTALERDLAGRARPKKAAAARHDELRHRDIHAGRLAELLRETKAVAA